MVLSHSTDPFVRLRLRGPARGLRQRTYDAAPRQLDLEVVVTEAARTPQHSLGRVLEALPRGRRSGKLCFGFTVAPWIVRDAAEREKIVARYPHFALWTDDADATARRIHERGLVCRDVISGPTGLRQLFVKDPDGNMIEFLGPSASAGERRLEPRPAR